MAFGNLGTIWSEIGLETKRLSAGVTTAKMKLSELDRQAMTKTASINAKLRSIGTGLQTVGKRMSMYVTLPLMAVGAASVKAGMDFDSGMTKSLAIMNNITPQIRKQMELTAKDVVKYTTFSAKEGADAYFYLASAGLDAAQSIEALPKVAKFAQAGNFDLALATDLLTDAQSALGLTIRDDVVANMENMTRVSDVLVKANTLSNATVRQFSESLTNKAGPALRMLNKDLEEGTAVLAVYADQGIKGAEAGNYLNIILRDLQRSSINNAEAFKQFGVDVFDASGQVRNIADIIGDLENALDGMSDKEKRATLMMMGFQDRSISAMMALLGTSDAIRNYETELRSATGFTEKVAAKQMESFTAQVEQLKNELVLIGIQIFDILRPRLESLVEWVKKSIDWFDSLADSQKRLVIDLGIFAAAIGPVAYALGGLTKIVAGLNTAMASLGVTLGVTTGMATGMVAALAIGLARFGVDIYTYVNAFKALEDSTVSWQRKFVNFIPFFDRFAVTFAEWMGLSEEQIRNIDTLTGGTKELNEVLESTEKFIKKHSETLPLASAAMVDLIQNYQDGTLSQEGFKIGVEELREATQNGRVDIEEAASSVDDFADKQEIARIKVEAHTKAQEEAKQPIEDTTEAIEEQEKTVDELTEAFSRGDIEVGEYIEQLEALGLTVGEVEGAFESLIHDMFRTFNINYAVEESTQKYEESLKKLTNSYGVHKASQKEITQATWNYEDALAKNHEILQDVESTERDKLKAQWAVDESLNELNKTTRTYTTSEKNRKDIIAEVVKNMETLHLDMLIQYYDNDTSIEQQKEIQKQYIATGIKAVELGATSIESFAQTAIAFDMSSTDIIKYAGEMGIELDEATKARIININVDASKVPGAVQKVLDDLGRIKDKTVKITVRKYYEALGAVSGGAMGGIVGYGKGGIIGSDRAGLPILSAAYGMVTPQKGKVVPILAHEGEVILNTSQQRNLAEWIMNYAKTTPKTIGDTPEIHLHLEYNEELASQTFARLFAQKIGELQ